MSDQPITRASIIVPAFREADNLTSLTERLFKATTNAGMDVELIIVDDDSRDGSREIVAELAARYPVRWVVRENERGLSSAVLRGFEQATADLLVVMDADLQHPPELVPDLIRRLEAGDGDFVIGTRYDGGDIAPSWSWRRRLSSRMATLLARPLSALSDPMSGFFALRRETWLRAVDRLNPLGYKIGLELYIKARCRNPADVPYTFDPRHAGASKFGLRQQWLYARHLLRLYRFRFPIFFWIIVIGVAVGAMAGAVWFVAP